MVTPTEVWRIVAEKTTRVQPITLSIMLSNTKMVCLAVENEFWIRPLNVKPRLRRPTQ
jgi:hypothetical protein